MNIINLPIERIGKRRSFQTQRCLVVVDGFYEWQKRGKSKQPFVFEHEGGQPFAFGGVYEHDRVAIVTRPANDTVAKLHDRMPWIVAPEDYGAWLSGGPVPMHADSILLIAHGVSARMNNAANDDPSCGESVEAEF